MDAFDRAPSAPPAGLETVIVPPTKSLGGALEVRRALPSKHRQMVGPFIFFDQFGPVMFGPGQGMDVRPHPHIGLATVTYVFEGEILHRDSLGSVQPIRPGEVNWMTAGRGIVHSERTPPALRDGGTRLSGIQVWVALPRAEEEREPSFDHHPAEALPALEGEGKRARLIAGALWGARSPVRTLSEMFYAAVDLDPGAEVAIPPAYAERAAFTAAGAVSFAGGALEPGQLAVFAAGGTAVLRAGPSGARVMLLGGEPMDGPRHVYWNFVASSTERIEQAKADWQADRFGHVPGETEFIPLPSIGHAAVRYP